MRSVKKVSSYIIWKNKDIYWKRYKMQETLYIGQWLLSSPSKWEPWDLTQFSQLPLAALSYFPESHWLSEIFSLSKVILVLGKDRSCRAPDLGCRGTESPGWFDVSPKKLCMRCDAWAGALWWWSCQSPVATLLFMMKTLHLPQ